MGEVWNKFVLLMWKNYKQLVKHPIQTLFEVLAPTVFAIILVILRSLIPLTQHDVIIFTPFQTSLPKIAIISKTIVWSPTHPLLGQIMDNTILNMNEKNNFTTLTHRSFQNKTQMQFYLTNEVNIFSTLAAVEFIDDFTNFDDIGEQINITLRFPAELRTTLMSKYETWRTKYLYAGYAPGPREEYLNEGGIPGYNSEGFLIIQQELSFSIIRYLKAALPESTKELPEIYLRRFPHSEWTTDKLVMQIKSSVGIIFLLSYIYTAINIAKTVTHEKEKQLKEAMKIMGLTDRLLWTTWSLKFFIMLTVTSILMVTLLKLGWIPNKNLSVFTNVNPSVLFVFLLCFSCATISFCFSVSACFSNASSAATFAGLAWFLLYVPYYFMERFYNQYGFWEKLATQLCSNTAMAFGFRLILQYEAADVEIQWKNVLDLASQNPTLGHIMIMLLFDAVLYFIIALYVSSVFPGRFGVPKKWYYPFTRSYWCRGKYNKDKNSITERLPEVECEHIEAEPRDLIAGIQVRRLCKQFKKGKNVVNNLSLNMYRDQITVILGHNGAGKTTTISMLLGMFPSTSGTAIIEGCDIRSDIAGVRKSLGLCPQHNILFDDLTVSEHLYFYGRLKGMNVDETRLQIAKYIEMLQLKSKENANTSTLSGGMKRKLSIAIALCGNSKVVVLDEPTAGLDPSARRLIWDLLQTEKKGRTIILTTHFMDEADVLGDRIAIMLNGRLQCLGSSYFLKKQYGAGYHLIIDKSISCDVEKVTLLLSKYIPNIKVNSNIGSELVYLLSDEFSKSFESMLCDLEKSSNALGINTYGISLTTLEDVFLKIGAEHSHGIEENYTNINSGFQHTQITPPMSSDGAELLVENTLVNGWKLCLNQMQATFKKRLLSIMRNWLLLVIQIAIPIVFVIFILIINLQAGGNVDLPKFMITLNYYTNSVTVLSSNTDNLYGNRYLEHLTVNNSYAVLQWENVDLNKKILEEMSEQPNKVHYDYIVGGTMHENQSMTGWFNNIPYHSAPLTLQLILNAILHTDVSPKYSLQFFNHPLPYSFLNTKLVALLAGTTDETSMASNIAFSMAFVSAFYVLFYVRERTNKAKHLQFVSGMHVLPFWIPAFTVDFLTFLLTSLCLILVMLPFQANGFSSPLQIGRLLSLLLPFGFGMLPLMYLCSFLFNNAATGYTKMSFFNIFSGVGVYLVMEIIENSLKNFSQIRKVLDWLCLLFPHYSLSDGIHSLIKINAVATICDAVIDKCVTTKIPNIPNLTPFKCKVLVCGIERKCCGLANNYYSWEPPGILRNILALILVGVISFAILLCIEYEVFHKVRRAISLKFANENKITDSDTNTEIDNNVSLEIKKVQNLTQTDLNNTSLVMKDVKKYYGNHAAVQGISVMINQHECFGLLGVNGAGKTTTFKMMTGDIFPSSGNAWIYGLSINNDMKRIQQIIGYCPQFDALLDELTPRETLVIFGLIRGINKKKVNLIAEELARDFDFYIHLDKRIGELSGGNKRKLSTSIALIGDPMILYLDEPTTGMDPATKRYLWNCICQVRDRGKCIVLTSHSMEECEALCTRLAIMVNGRFMCLGSTQNLKNNFSNTYTLTIKLKKTNGDQINVDSVESFVKNSFHNVQVREKHIDLLVFNIDGKHQVLSKMFGLIENAKENLNIDSYSLGQCSLEQVFLRLTKYQIDNHDD